MNTFTPNKNSWHYKLVRNHIFDVYMGDTRMMPKNFCQYWRVVMWSSLPFILIGILGIGLLVMLSAYIYVDPIAAASSIGVIIGTLLIIFGIFWGLVSYREWKQKRTIEKLEKDQNSTEGESSLIRMKIRAYKQKVCPPVSYK